jgi:hypothetical protein
MPSNTARQQQEKIMTKAENYEILGRRSTQSAHNECVSKLFEKSELVELMFADGSRLNVNTWSEVQVQEFTN